jgi:hypothetical protein
MAEMIEIREQEVLRQLNAVYQVLVQVEEDQLVVVPEVQDNLTTQS